MERGTRTASLEGTIGKVAAVCAVVASMWLAGLRDVELVIASELVVLSGLLVLTPRRGRTRRRPLRTAVIGSYAATLALQEELDLADVRRYVVVGRVAPDLSPGSAAGSGGEPLGALADLRSVIERHRVDLLLMTDEPSRLQVFDELACHCDDLDVRLWELSGFYEEVFGHIPVAVINSAWFQYIMHPKYRPPAAPRERALDLVLGIAMTLLTLPLLATVALILRAQGGPILYRQVRIGERGRVFTMYKLCTMRHEIDEPPPWCSPDDPRITRVGRLLRRTHIDELPQLINVIRGEMSLVGPRPEQPHFVAELERTLPFYSRRHAIKPGITGWAQVHCGYAGSEAGSLWKLCHDLYYLKHRSTRLDFRIMWRTLRTLLARDQYRDTPVIPFVFRGGLDALQPAVAGVEMGYEGEFWCQRLGIVAVRANASAVTTAEPTLNAIAPAAGGSAVVAASMT
ncbi:MAG: sugar transferase, partial [Solirubrobacteraceae bacterium]